METKDPGMMCTGEVAVPPYGVQRDGSSIMLSILKLLVFMLAKLMQQPSMQPYLPRIQWWKSLKKKLDFIKINE